MTYPNRRPAPEGSPYHYSQRPRYEDRNRSWRREDDIQEPAPAPFVPEGKKLLILKDRYHDFTTIVRMGRAGPSVVLDRNNLHKDWEGFAKQNFTATEAEHKNALIVAMHEGKFVVLVGHDLVSKISAIEGDFTLAGNLLSNPGIKKAYLGDVKS